MITQNEKTMPSIAEIRHKVQWRDLTRMTLLEKLIENTLTIPWLLTSLGLAYYEHYTVAFIFSFFFFLTALRQVHNGFHNALGTGRNLTWFILFLNSIFMMTSIHAVQFNHLRHHKHCLNEGDFEGKCARMKWYKALLYGPMHIFSIHYSTIRYGKSKDKVSCIIELISISVVTGLIFYLQIDFLIFHVIAMIIGEFLSAFFAVWTVHHDSEGLPFNARTIRTKWKNYISFNMFFHMEHHLFPAVPTIKLPELAKRIDACFPEMKIKETF